jgi:signal transduction histidine kinase
MARTSLQQKLLFPILTAVLLATVAISVLAYGLAKANAESEWTRRFRAIGTLVDRENIPLAQNVLQLLANLTSAHWIAVGPQGAAVTVVSPADQPQTISIAATDAGEELNAQLPEWSFDVQPPRLRLGNAWFRGVRLSRKFPRARPDGTTVAALVILIDDSKPQQTIVQSLVLPILVGMVAISIMTIVTFWTTSRWAKRIGLLQKEVNAIATGHFPNSLHADGDDELSRLSHDVTQMSNQLSESWKKLRQLHGQQMLHNLSGGMAHNLRNTLTGARMAIELASDSTFPEPDGARDSNRLVRQRLDVAIRQIEQAEAYIKRILQLAQGRLTEERRMTLAEGVQILQATLDSTAAHRQKQLTWSLGADLDRHEVRDGEMLVAAASNLVWNGLDAGTEVVVQVSIEKPVDEHPETADKKGLWGKITVRDNGPGLSAEVAETVFEPFVTTKPDGSGLGLAYVARAAQLLGGMVEWRREDRQTLFELRFALEEKNCP